MKQEMKELANIKDEVTEGVCETVTDNLDRHMKVFVAATEEIKARVRSVERDVEKRKKRR